MGPINWASKTAHVEAIVNTVHEGHWAIADAVVKNKELRPGVQDVSAEQQR